MLIKCSIVLIFVTTGHMIYIASDETNSICGGGFCGPDKISYTEILHMYRGLFFNEKQMVEREQKILSARKKDLNNEGLNASKVLGLPGDGDSCCATDFVHVKKVSLANTDGVVRYIVHMPDASPPMYQLIPEGSCIYGYGKCDGKCFMEPLTLNLLVYDQSEYAPWPPVMFDWFEVPGYCSCKNVLTSVVSGTFESKLSASHVGRAQP